MNTHNDVYNPNNNDDDHDPLDQPLELTKEHMLFVIRQNPSSTNKQDDTKTTSGWYPASSLQRGDRIVTTNGIEAVVDKIETVTRRGLYGPLTPSGCIVVSGVLASNYVGMQGDTAYFMVGSVSTAFTYQWLAKTFEGPHRLYCSVWDCSHETYTVDGLSLWVYGPYRVVCWLLDQPVVVWWIVVVPMMCVLVVLLCVVEVATSGLSAVVFVTPGVTTTTTTTTMTMTATSVVGGAVLLLLMMMPALVGVGRRRNKSIV